MSAPNVARVVVLEAVAKPAKCRAVLAEAAGLLREDADLLVCPGGFLRAQWPRDWAGRAGWDSREADLAPLRSSAAQGLARVLDAALLKRLRLRARWLSLGVDLFESEAEGSARPHAELVAVVDLDHGAVHGWTAKTYPTRYQELTLVRQRNVSTHLVRFGGWRALVLGCHDLNMFSARAWANQAEGSKRREICSEMRAEAARFRPNVVLQHPHTTDTPNIWQQGWAGVRKLLPSASAFAGGVLYADPRRTPRAPLADVLARTRSCDGEDVVIS